MARPKKKSTKEKLDDLLEVSEEIKKEAKPKVKSKSDFPFPELEPDEFEEPSQVEIISAKDAAAIVVKDESVVTVATGNEFQDDFANSKAVLQKMLKRAEQALDGVLGVAGESGSARAYEVAGGIIKTAAEIARDIVILHKSKAEIEKIKFPDGGGDIVNPTPNKNGDTYIFQGTSLDFLKEIKKAKAAANQKETDK